VRAIQPGQRRSWSSLLLVLLLLLGAAPPAAGGPASEQLARDLERVLAVLADEGLKARPEARQRAVRGLVGELFDLHEMAVPALGPHWPGRTEAERARFVALLGSLVEAQLLMLDGAAGPRVRFLGEIVEGDQALVHSRVGGERTETEVNYRLRRLDGRWRVSDVLLDGVSAVDSYRAQFHKVISTGSFEELLRKLAVLR
jgi:phospholipid transport system substrate-binding protein